MAPAELAPYAAHWDEISVGEEPTGMRIVVALGGNAMLQRGERPDADAQTGRLAPVGGALRTLAAKHDLVITRGNGPQVGLLAAQSQADPVLRSAYPLDAARRMRSCFAA